MKTSVDIIIPVYHGNLHELKICIERLVATFHQKLSQYDWKVIVVVNGLQAGPITQLAKSLSETFSPKVHYAHTPNAGKGWGVLHGWQNSQAKVKAYMDVDLSCDPNQINKLIDPIMTGQSDMVVGSRYHADSKVKRSMVRRFVSMTYNQLFVRRLLKCPISDLQCGFKAVSKRIMEDIVPLVKDREWFFESEMIYLAHRQGLRIKEIAVDWSDRDESAVKLHKVAPQFVSKSFELRRRRG